MAVASFQSPSTNPTPWSAHFAAFSRLRTSARTSLPCFSRCRAVAPPTFPVMPMTKYMPVFSLLFLQRYGDRICSPVLRRGASLEFKGELKRWPILSMVCDEKCLVLFHGLGQLLKVGLGELSRQEVCL